MGNTSKGCGCSTLNNFTTCDNQSSTSSSDTEVVMDATTIHPTDQILIVRGGYKETRVYKGSWNDLSPETALLILAKATQSMPRIDPADGCSLWIDNGFIKIASGNANNLGMQSQAAFDQNLQISMENLPTSDPGNGKPWLCGGVIMIGQNRTTKGCR